MRFNTEIQRQIKDGFADKLSKITDATESLKLKQDFAFINQLLKESIMQVCEDLDTLLQLPCEAKADKNLDATKIAKNIY